MESKNVCCQRWYKVVEFRKANIAGQDILLELTVLKEIIKNEKNYYVRMEKPTYGETYRIPTL